MSENKNDQPTDTNTTESPSAPPSDTPTAKPVDAAAETRAAAQPGEQANQQPEQKPEQQAGQQADKPSDQQPDSQPARKAQSEAAASAPAKPAAKKPATKADKPKSAAKPRKSAGATFALLLALIALLIACAASFYGWMQLQALNQQLDSQQQAVAKIDQSSQMVTFKQNMAKRLDRFSDNQHVLERRLDALNSAVAAAAAAGQRDQRDWVLAEAEYLMNMANARLHLLRDVKSAIAALKGADQRIASLSDPSLFPVQQALAAEISDLQATGVMNSNGIALTLINIGKLVRKMPPAKVVMNAEKAADEERNPVVAELFNKLGIRKNQRAYAARPTEVDILNIDQKILLDLDAARHAVLRLDPQTYTAHLNAALATLAQHYDADNQQVQTVRKELQAINARAIFPSLPDISGSTLALNQARSRYAALQAEAAAEPASKPAPPATSPATSKSAQEPSL